MFSRVLRKGLCDYCALVIMSGTKRKKKKPSPDDNLVCWFGYFVKCLILCNITLIVPQLFAHTPFISILCRINDQTYLSEDSILCFLHISHWTFGATLPMWFLHSLCTSFLPLVTISLTHYRLIIIIIIIILKSILLKITTMEMITIKIVIIGTINRIIVDNFDYFLICLALYDGLYNIFICIQRKRKLLSVILPSGRGGIWGTKRDFWQGSTFRGPWQTVSYSSNKC